MADEIDAIWAEHDTLARYDKDPQWAIRKCSDDLWRVEYRDRENVAPSTAYVTMEEAAARLLQLMGIDHPIEPQTWPEDVGLRR